MAKRYKFKPTSSDCSFSARFGDVDYTCRLIWHDTLSVWTISIYSKKGAVTTGRVIVPRKNLLGNSAGSGQLFFDGKVPTLTNLGTDECPLLWVAE